MTENRPAWLTTAVTCSVTFRCASIVCVVESSAETRAESAATCSRTTTAWSSSLEIVMGISPRLLASVMTRCDEEIATEPCSSSSCPPTVSRKRYPAAGSARHALDSVRSVELSSAVAVAPMGAWRMLRNNSY